MNPLRVEARNFRSWETLALDIPEGCTAIVGSNGAGKSSILQLIETCLFGGRLDRLLRRGATEMEIELEFEHNGSGYRIRRHYTASRQGKSALDFETRDGMIAFTHATQAETQQAIQTLLGVTQETWRASAYLAQGNGAAFTDAKPAERKDILADALGLQVYDTLRDRAARECASARARLLIVNADLDYIPKVVGKDPVGEIEDWIRDAREEHELLLREMSEIEQKIEQARVIERLQAEARHKLQILEGVKANHEHAEAKLADANRASGNLEVARQGAKPLRDLRAKHEAYQVRLAEYQATKTAVNEQRRQGDEIQQEADRADVEVAKILEEGRRQRDSLEAMSSAIDTDEMHCPTCGQRVHDEARRRVRDAMQHDMEALRGRYEQARRNQAASRMRLEGLQDTLRAFAMIKAPEWSDGERAALAEAERAAEALHRWTIQAEQREQIEQDAEKHRTALAEAQKASEAAAQALRDAGDGTGDVTALQAGARAKAGEVTESAAALAKYEAQLEQARKRDETLAKLQAERDMLMRAASVTDALTAAYSRNGIPALIMETNAIPQIESEASEILEALGTSYRVELRTQRALKSGAGTRETLDIVVMGPTGEAFYEDFSGGEKTKLNLALRIALARILATRRGADIQLLAIDEPEFLDEASVERLAVVLHGMRGDFARILLVSHVPALRDSFDQVIEIERDEVSGVA